MSLCHCSIQKEGSVLSQCQRVEAVMYLSVSVTEG